MSLKYESKREQRKRHRKASRKYLKGWFGSKIGFYITGTSKYLFNKYKFIFKIKYLVIFCLILSISMLFLIGANLPSYLDAKSSVNTYSSKVNKVQSENDKTIDILKDSKIELNKASEQQSKVINNANVLIDDLVHYMFSYDSQNEYDRNRKKAKTLFEDKLPNDIYSTGYDSNNEGIIKNLGLTSSIQSVRIYNQDKNNKSGDTLYLKAVVSYKSKLKDVSNDNASHKHNVVYDFKINAEDNKIISMKQVKNLKTEYEVS